MNTPKKAPTIKEIRLMEENDTQKKQARREKDAVKSIDTNNEIDRKNAELIIEHLAEMFLAKNVSSSCGCWINKIPSDICTNGVLRYINEYLDGEWTAKFIANTGNAHDFEMTCTLDIKPR
jgi:hypothetical protein